MQKVTLQIIGTHLEILIDTDLDIGILENEIFERLSNFEKKFSRFLENNWLYTLNRERK